MLYKVISRQYETRPLPCTVALSVELSLRAPSPPRVRASKQLSSLDTERQGGCESREKQSYGCWDLNQGHGCWRLMPGGPCTRHNTTGVYFAKNQIRQALVPHKNTHSCAHRAHLVPSTSTTARRLDRDSAETVGGRRGTVSTVTRGKETEQEGEGEGGGHLLPAFVLPPAGG